MQNKKGFSLVELLVAVTIMLILAGAVGVKVWGWVSKARIARAESDIESLKTAINLYEADNSCLPTERQGLEALIEKPVIPPVPKKWRDGGYLESKSLPLDPWDNPYVYIAPTPKNKSFEIISYGADGEPGGEGEDADISSLKGE